MRTWIPVVLLAAAAALSGCSQLGEPETTPNPDGSKTCIDRKCIDVTMRPGKECTEDGKEIAVIPKDMSIDVSYKLQLKRPDGQLVSGEFFQGLNPRACP